jgi:hypothetical protein
VKAIFYSRVHLRRLVFGELVDSYSSWALGLDAYRHTRDRRLEAGVPLHVSTKDLVRGGSFRGTHDCSIETRDAEGAFLLRFTHRDADNGGVLWHTAVRVTNAGVGAVLEHGAARSAPRRAVLGPVAASPRVFVRAVERNGADIDPRDLWDTGVLQLPAGDVPDFVTHLLVDDERRIPFLLVSPTNDAGMPLVPPPKLAQRLAGMARVVHLMDKAAAFRLSGELKGLSFSNSFGFSDGAVRLFHPGMRPGQSPFQHYLWLRSRIEGYRPEHRLDTLAGEVAARIVERTQPIGFFELIEDYDRRERQRTATLVLQASVASPSVAAEREALVQAVSDRDARMSALVSSLESAQRDLRDLLGQHEELEKKLREAEDKNIELQLEAEERESKLRFDCDEQAQRLRDLSGVIETLKAERSAAGVSPEVRDAVEAVLQGAPTLEQSLVAISALYSDRVVILPEAWKAARESRGFQRGGDAFELLYKLATRYWEALQQGRGDVEARGIFGNAYAARESDVVESNKRARQARTFAYNGGSLLMLKHLKIGIKDSLSETLRVHFEWLAKERRLVIGHCGGHLPFR